MRHNFVVFEGVDGSGKSTVIKEIISRLGKGPIALTREPRGYTIPCQQMYDILVDKDFKLCPEAELALVLASRAENLNKTILPYLKSSHVFCDRFAESTMAYQGAGRGLVGIESMVYDPKFYVKPDLTIILDVPLEVSIERMVGRKSEDKFDNETKDFMLRIREYFLSLESDSHIVIDASQELDKVLDRTTEVLLENLEWS